LKQHGRLKGRSILQSSYFQLTPLEGRPPLSLPMTRKATHMRLAYPSATLETFRNCFRLGVVIASCLASLELRASVLTWDADTGTHGSQDGGGIWDNLNTTNWWDETTNAQWNNTAPDSATFGSGSGIAGVVTLGSEITVNNLAFNSPGSDIYTIAGGGHTLTLSNSVISGTAGAIISANLAGNTGLSLTNTGIIRLSGANTYTGATSILGGTLQVDSVGALGGSEAISIGSSGGVVGTLLLSVPDSTTTAFGAGKTGTLIGAGVNGLGALRGQDNASNTWAGNIAITSAGSSISGGSGGTLRITGVISGNGPVQFGNNPNATTILGAVNSYTGDTQLTNSVAGSTSTLKLEVDNAINANSRLTGGTPSSSGASLLDLNGHALTLRSIGAGSKVTIINNGAVPATLTLSATNNVDETFSGSINDGISIVSLTKSGQSTQSLVGTNTYTGPTTVNAGSLWIGHSLVAFGGGSIASPIIRINGGQLFVTNEFGVNNNDRLSDAASLMLAGGEFYYLGSRQAATNSSETIHDVVVDAKLSFLNVRFFGTNSATVLANQLTRPAGGGVALVNGVNLGRDGTSSGSVARILLSSAPLLVGTTEPSAAGINSSAQNTKIIPFLLGESGFASGNPGTATNNSSTFVTYEPTTGLRPLNPIDEFTNNAIVSGNNIRLTSNTTSPAAVAINSLIMAGGTLSIADTLTNTSGAMLFHQNSSLISGGTLEFGAAEAIVTLHGTANAIISSNISGSQGLTMTGVPAFMGGNLTLSNPNSTYSGITRIWSGGLILGANSTGSAGNVTSGPLGRSTLALAGASIRTVSSDSDVTIGNPILLEQPTQMADGGGNLTFSGPVTIVGKMGQLFNASLSKIVTFSGSIGDNGNNLGLSVGGASMVVLSGNNTYTGDTLANNVIVSGSLSADGLVRVGTGGIGLTYLGGSGRVGNVTATAGVVSTTGGPTIDPGNTKNVAGNLRTNAFSLTNGAHLGMHIGGLTAGGESIFGYDQVTAEGPVMLTGADLALSFRSALTLNNGDQFFLIVNNSNTSITGEFATVNRAPFDPAYFTVGGREFRLNYNGNFAGPGSDGMANDVVLVAVPEPASSFALISGFGFLALSRRRCRLLKSGKWRPLATDRSRAADRLRSPKRDRKKME
jgi:autotransporter-associated beta strand protein